MIPAEIDYQIKTLKRRNKDANSEFGLSKQMIATTKEHLFPLWGPQIHLFFDNYKLPETPPPLLAPVFQQIEGVTCYQKGTRTEATWSYDSPKKFSQ